MKLQKKVYMGVILFIVCMAFSNKVGAESDIVPEGDVYQSEYSIIQ